MFIFVFVLAFVDLFLNATWNPFYYRFGIPIYRRTFKANGFPAQPPSAEEVETAVPQEIWTGIAVHQLDKDLLAFREKLVDWRLFRMKYTPLMHGALKFDKPSGTVKVVGFLNWFPVAFACLFIGGVGFAGFATGEFFAEFLFFPLFLIGLFTFIYVIQRNRFEIVAETAVKLWMNNEIEDFSVNEWKSEKILE